MHPIRTYLNMLREPRYRPKSVAARRVAQHNIRYGTGKWRNNAGAHFGRNLLAIGVGLAALLCATLPLPVMALSSDRNKPMHIEADRAELDDRTGISTYRGNVVVTQGTMALKADTLTVHNRKRRIIKVVAEGSPAQFKQRPDNQTQDVTAYADRIEYDGEKGQLTLSGSARVLQAENVFHSDRIVYDIKRNVVNAGGESSEMTDQSRVRITIQPDRNPSNNTPAPDPQ